jgi:drug/metabolite transporter (DMT)-like permease
MSGDSGQGATGSLVFGAAMVGLSSVLFGLIPFFARSLTDAGIAPPAVSMFRYLVPALVFLPFLRLRGPLLPATLWGLVSGFLVALGWVGYVKALTLMPVPVAGVLYMTYPLLVLVVGWMFFADRPHPMAALGGALILVAAVIVAWPAIAAEADATFGPGAVLLALAAPLGFGLGVNVLTHKLVVLTTPSRIASFAAGSVVGLMPLVLTLPVENVLPSDAREWGLVLGLSVLTALIPQLLYTTWVPRIGAAKSGAMGAIELPTMFAVGWAVMGDPVGPREIVAGVLVMAAILLTPSKAPEGGLSPTGTTPPSSPPAPQRRDG